MSIRRMHNELDILFQETTKKLVVSYKRPGNEWLVRRLDSPRGLLWKTSAAKAPNFAQGKKKGLTRREKKR